MVRLGAWFAFSRPQRKPGMLFVSASAFVQSPRHKGTFIRLADSQASVHQRANWSRRVSWVDASMATHPIIVWWLTLQFILKSKSRVSFLSRRDLSPWQKRCHGLFSLLYRAETAKSTSNLYRTFYRDVQPFIITGQTQISGLVFWVSFLSHRDMLKATFDFRM